jgi:hypothetical protein
MQPNRKDEWEVIEKLLPAGWKQAAKDTKAFQRARYITDPGPLLRLLLFHAVNDAGLRETVTQARASGIAEMSQVALLKRVRSSGAWLSWLGAELCRDLRDEPRLPHGLRPRAVDSTTIQGPASKGTEWRVHYSLDLPTLTCDSFEVTDAHGAELLERTPMRKGDVLLADRNFLRAAGVRAAVRVGAHILVRLRWTHTPMTTPEGRQFRALARAKRLRVGKVAGWPVRLHDPEGPPIAGRVVATKLPEPLAAKAERRTMKTASKKGRRPDPRSLEAAHLVMVFTTLPKALLSDVAVLELYRYRWQIELAFKRLKQLLKIGRLPHQDPIAAKSWIHAKLVVALLLETLFRRARVFSPWGYAITTATLTRARGQLA